MVRKHIEISWGIVAAFLLISASPAFAEQLFVLGGGMLNLDGNANASSSSWQLDYRAELLSHLDASLSYLNEGHVPNHHRDGVSFQLWTGADLLESRLSISAGVGPYYYFDTTTPPVPGASYRNDHGFGSILTLASIWKGETPWLFQVRTNWVNGFGSIDTLSVLAGIGYQLEAPFSTKAVTMAEHRKKTTDNEITFFVGRTITNSFSSEHSGSLCMEYRRGLMRYLDWTAGLLYEGDTRLVRRSGMTSQLWGVKAFLDDNFVLGAGAGAYIALDHRSASSRNDSRVISLIATMTASYRFSPHWSVRTNWNRIVTNYDRDTDVIMGGIGYRF